MHFRQSGLRDERRRRVLMDEATSGGDSVLADASVDASVDAAATPSAAVAASSYDAAAMDAGRYRLTDLIPLRIWTVSVLTLGGLAMIAGIQSLYGGVLHGPAMTLPASALSALDVAAAGSLAAWFASLLLTLAALASVLIYTLRRHRVDDYRGTYQIWLWASAALGWASIDATARLHEVLRELLPRLTGTPLLGDGTAWWLAIYGLLYGGLTIRMLVEMRRCRSATTMCLLAGICYGISASLLLGWPRLDDGLLEAMVHSSLVLVAHGSLLLCVTLYARYVLLDAQGRIAKQPKKLPRKARNDASANPPKAKRRKATRVDDAHATGTSGRRRRSDLDESGKDEEAEDSSRGRSQRSSSRDGASSGGDADSTKRVAQPNTEARRAAATQSAARTTSDAKAVATKDAPASEKTLSSGLDAQKPAAGKFANAAKPPLEVKRRAAEPTEAYDDDDLNDGESSDDGGDDSGLSKAERRRMRKMKRRQQA